MAARSASKDCHPPWPPSVPEQFSKNSTNPIVCSATHPATASGRPRVVSAPENIARRPRLRQSVLGLPSRRPTPESARSLSPSQQKEVDHVREPQCYSRPAAQAAARVEGRPVRRRHRRRHLAQRRRHAGRPPPVPLLCGEDGYVAPTLEAVRSVGRAADRTPHNRWGYRVRRNSISHLSSFQGMRFPFCRSTSQLASALAFISRSTSA